MFILFAFGFFISYLQAGSFPIDEVLKKLGSPKAPMKSIDEFVPKLSKKFHRSHVKIYHSVSEYPSICDEKVKEEDQKHVSPTSPKMPRVFVYDPEDAETVISYRGNPAHLESFNSLQFYTFTENPEPKYDFYQVTFPVEYDDAGRPKFQRNPPACLGCHGAPPLPIVDAYNVWPGWFGSQDDRLEIGQLTDSAEYKALQALFENPASIPRYKVLEKRGEGRDYLDQLPERRLTIYNMTVSKQYARVLASRLAKELANSPYRYAALLSLGCSAGDSIATELAQSPEERVAETKRLNKVKDGLYQGRKKYFEERIEKLRRYLRCYFKDDAIAPFVEEELASYSKPYDGEGYERGFVERGTSFRHVLNTAGVQNVHFGLDAARGDLVPDGSGYLFSDLYLELGRRLLTGEDEKDLRSAFLKARINTEELEVSKYKYPRFEGGAEPCSALRAKNTAALRKLGEPEVPAPIKLGTPPAVEKSHSEPSKNRP